MPASLLDHWTAIIGLAQRVPAAGSQRLDSANRLLDELAQTGSDDAVRTRLARRDEPGQSVLIDDLGLLVMQLAVQQMGAGQTRELPANLLEWLHLISGFTTKSGLFEAHAKFLDGLVAIAKDHPLAARDAFRAARELYAAIESPPLAQRAAHCGLALAAADLDAADDANREFAAALVPEQPGDARTAAWRDFVLARQTEFAASQQLLADLAAAPDTSELDAIDADLRRRALRALQSRTMRAAGRGRPGECVTTARQADRLAASLGQPATMIHEAAALCAQHNKWDFAEALYRAAAEVDPTNQDVALGLADAVLNLGRPEEAAGLLETLAERVPDYARTARDLGVAYMQLDRIADAQQQFERALALDPEDAMARTLLNGLRDQNPPAGVAVDKASGTVYLSEDLLRGDAESLAVQLTAAVLALMPADESENALADIAKEKGPDFTAKVARLLGHQPAQTDAERHFAEAEALFQRRDFEPATSEYQAVLRLDPDRADALMGLGDCNFMVGRFHLAAAYFEESLAVTPSAPTARFLSDAFYRTGRLDKAIEACRRSIEIDPTYTPARKQLELLEAARPAPQPAEQAPPPTAPRSGWLGRLGRALGLTAGKRASGQAVQAQEGWQP